MHMVDKAQMSVISIKSIYFRVNEFEVGGLNDTLHIYSIFSGYEQQKMYYDIESKHYPDQFRLVL